MNVLYAVGSFYPDNSGGPNITMYWMAKSLYKSGIDIKVLTTDRGVPASLISNDWLESDFGKVRYIKTKQNALPLHLFMASIKAIQYHKNIYLASFFYPLSFLLAPFAVLLGKKVIWAPRGETSSSALQYGNFRKKLVLSLIKIIKKRILFHATSEQEVADIKSALGDCQIVMIPVGMEIPLLINPMTEPKDILFLGRIHPIKGLENLLEALARSKRFVESPHILKLAGYAQLGYDRQLLELAERLGISHKIHFIGRIEGETKNQIIASAYFLVLPSFSENFGAVVAESLAQGTPCIASTGTPWHTLETFEAGFHVENTPNELSNSIDKLLALNPSNYQKFRQNARTLAEQTLNVDQYVEQWKQILR
jgi:glycosyltransferase involved in cell wall biosynthesis